MFKPQDQKTFSYILHNFNIRSQDLKILLIFLNSMPNFFEKEEVFDFSWSNTYSQEGA